MQIIQAIYSGPMYNRLQEFVYPSNLCIKCNDNLCTLITNLCNNIINDNKVYIHLKPESFVITQQCVRVCFIITFKTTDVVKSFLYIYKL